MREQKKEKSPAFQFYPKDVLSDGNAMAMPPEAFGIYMKLLCYDWIDDGIVDDHKIWRRLGGYEHHNFQGEERDVEDWDIIYSYLKPQFVPHPDKEGYVTNPRLLKERANQSERSRSAKESANKRWESERNANALSPHTNGICEVDANRCSSSSSSSSSSKEENTKAPDSQIKNPEEPKTRTHTMQLPRQFDTPKTRDALKRWAAHRRKLKKAFDEMAAEALVLLWAHDPSGFVKAVNNSISQGWSEPIKPKNEPGNGSIPSYQDTTPAEASAVLKNLQQQGVPIK